MSKIYAALEHAQEERKSRDTSGADTVAAYPGPIPTIVPRPAVAPVPAPHAADVTVEHEIAALYDPVLARFEGGRGIVAFTSPNPGAGTSTVARKFALFLSQHAGHATLLVDADRQDPSQINHFRVAPEADSEAAPAQAEPLDVTILAVQDSDLKLAKLANGRRHLPVPLGTRRANPLLAGFRDQFEVTVIDCPPPSVAPDTVSLAATADGVVLVVDADGTRAWQAQRSVDVIEAGGGRIIGLVFNKRRFYIPRWLYGRL